jgi:uncharacterized protein (DUF1330 family)
VPDNAPEVQLVRRWLDSWSGVGLVLAGMAHQGYDVQRTAYAASDRRATFLPGRDRALHRGRVGVQADGAAGGAEGGVAGAHRKGVKWRVAVLPYPKQLSVGRPTKMPAYVIADTHITDHKTYDDYKRQVAPLIQKFGGRFLVRGGQHVILEGTWNPARLVVIEFPSMEAAMAWYKSPEYAPLLALRQPAATDHLVAIEGS